MTVREGEFEHIEAQLSAHGLTLPPENVFAHTYKLEFFLDWLQRLQASKGDLSVVDVGCGNGRQVTRFLEPFAAKVVGLDLHPGCIEYAQRRFGSERTQFKVSLIEDLDETFDVAVMSDVLEHVDDPSGLLAHVADHVTDGGHLLISVPNGRGPFEIESSFSRWRPIGPLSVALANKAAGFLNRFVFVGAWSRVLTPDDAPYNHESPHVQFFTHGDIERLLHDNGFEILEQRKLACVAGPVTNTLLAPWHWALRVNIALGERLPTNWTVAWCFVARRLPRPAISAQRRNEGRPTHAKDE